MFCQDLHDPWFSIMNEDTYEQGKSLSGSLTKNQKVFEIIFKSFSNNFIKNYVALIFYF